MADNDDTADEIWPGSGITYPGWNPNGVLGGIADMHPPVNTLNAFMTREQQESVDWGDTPNPLLVTTTQPADAIPATVSDGVGLINQPPAPNLAQAGSDPLAGSIACPSPFDISLYRVGGNVGAFGGKLSTYGAGLAEASTPALLVPGAEGAGVTGMAAGGMGMAVGGPISAVGSGIQITAGLLTGLKTGDWGLASAAAAPVLADHLRPMDPLVGSAMDDKLQSIIESGNRIIQSCRGLGE